MSAFGDNLVSVLEQRNLNQAGLAKLINSKPQYISQLVRGRRSPNSDTVERIAIALSVPPVSLDPHWGKKRRPGPLFKMQGVEVAYLETCMAALIEARRVLLQQSIADACRHAAGKTDTFMFDALPENTIVAQLLSFSEHCAIFTEENDVKGNKASAPVLSYFIDPFDRSKPFAAALEATARHLSGNRTVAEAIQDQTFTLRGLEAPYGSITCVRDSRIVFSCMIDYADGRIFVACAGMVKEGSIEQCPDPQTLAIYGEDVVFEPRDGTKCVAFLGHVGSESKKKAQEYRTLFADLGFRDDQAWGNSNPGGPARILYLTERCEEDGPAFILSNGEKICEWLGWFAYATFSGQLAIHELHPEHVMVRDNILCAPPPSYTAFSPSSRGGFDFHLDRITALSAPSRYRGAFVVTHIKSVEVLAKTRSMTRSRELLPNVSFNGPNSVIEHIQNRR